MRRRRKRGGEERRNGRSKREGVRRYGEKEDRVITKTEEKEK